MYCGCICLVWHADTSFGYYIYSVFHRWSFGIYSLIPKNTELAYPFNNIQKGEHGQLSPLCWYRAYRTQTLSEVTASNSDC